MKIAQVSATFPPYMAGTGNVCYHISLELAKRGHDVTVYTSRFPDVDYKYPDILKVKRFKPLFQIGNAPFTPELLKLKDFDIIHLHYPYYFGGEMVYIASKLWKQKYVITYHNDVIGLGLLRLFLKLHKDVLMKFIITNAYKIIVPSIDFARNSHLNTLTDIDHSVVEIPNGVDINKFHPEIDCNDIRDKYNLWDKDVLLFVRALDKAHYHSGLEYLLKSFTKIENKSAVLLIVGGGNLKNYYISLSKKLGVANKVIFVGSVPNEDMPRYYVASDIVVLPSILTESFGMILIEAMATGKTVIASNLPGVRTVVDDGKDGLLIVPKNVNDLTSKIQYLLDNEELRSKFGKSGREKIKKRYPWEKIAKETEKVYLSLI